MKVQYSVYSVIVIGVLLVIIYFLGTSVRNYQSQLNVNEKNILALTDSVDVYKNKNGVVVTERRQLVSNVDDLKKLNKDLYDELMKSKGRGTLTGGTKTVIEFDTVYVLKSIQLVGANIDSTVVDTISDSAITTIVKIPVRASSKDSIITMNMDSIKVSTNIQLGVTVVNTRRNIFSPYQMTSVSTSDSRFHVASLSSWDKLDKPKPRIILRPGLTAAVVYDPFGRDVKVGVGGGAVLTIIKK